MATDSSRPPTRTRGHKRRKDPWTPGAVSAGQVERRARSRH